MPDFYTPPIRSPLYRFGDWITDSVLMAHRSCPLYGRLFNIANRDGGFRLTAGGATFTKFVAGDLIPDTIVRAATCDLIPARLVERAPHLPTGTTLEDVAHDPTREPWYVEHGDRLLVFDGARTSPTMLPDDDLPTVDEWWLTADLELTADPCLVGTAGGERRFLITPWLL
ncbi:MAG: hypothetical protein R2695_04000 [Acidimicrobiales bacterium]